MPSLRNAFRISVLSALLSSMMRMWFRRPTASSDGDREEEIGSFSGFGFHPDPPIITLDDALADSQSDTRSRIVVRAMKSCKQAKDLLLILGLNAYSI